MTFYSFNVKFVESTKYKESKPNLALHIKNQEHNRRRTGAEEEWKKNRARKFAPGCQNPHCAKISIGANFGVGANFGHGSNFGTGANFRTIANFCTGANFGTGANFSTSANFLTMPNSCVRNPLSPPLLTF